MLGWANGQQYTAQNAFKLVLSPLKPNKLLTGLPIAYYVVQQEMNVFSCVK
jgi:hypothetical protein